MPWTVVQCRRGRISSPSSAILCLVSFGTSSNGTIPPRLSFLASNSYSAPCTKFSSNRRAQLKKAHHTFGMSEFELLGSMGQSRRQKLTDSFFVCSNFHDASMTARVIRRVRLGRGNLHRKTTRKTRSTDVP